MDVVHRAILRCLLNKCLRAIRSDLSELILYADVGLIVYLHWFVDFAPDLCVSHVIKLSKM